MEGDATTATAAAAEPVAAPVSKDQSTPDAAVEPEPTTAVTAESEPKEESVADEGVAVATESKDEEKPAEEVKESALDATESTDDKASKPKREKATPPPPARTSGREQRVRKSVDAFDPTSVTKKEIIIPSGKGEKLEDMPRVVANFKNITWSDPHLKMLYSIVFGVGKKREFKTHLFQFNGVVFPEGKEEDEREKLKLKMYKLVLGDLKEVMDLCDIDRSAESFGTKGTPDKEMLCNRFLEWLECPKSSGKKVKAPAKKAAAKKSPAAKTDSAKKRDRSKGATSKEKGSAKKAKGAAKAKVVEDNDEIAINISIPGVSIEKVREKVKSIVENANREELTVKGVRKMLEEWLDEDLSEHKDAIRSLVMEAM